MTHPVGIIGLGMIGETMMREFLAHPSFTVAAAWDINPQIRSRIQEKNPEVSVLENGEQLFEDPKIHLIYIATPPTTHIAYGLKVIEKRKALFMEKPLSIDLAKSQHLVKSAEKNKTLTAMNFGYGAGPTVDALEKVIANQEIGKILSIEIRYQFPSWPLPNQLSAKSWITNKHTGGFVREMFSHHVYLMHRLFGLLTVRSAEVSYSQLKDASEQFVIASLQTGEIPVWFMGGICSPKTPRNSEFTINGDFGSVRISESHQLLYAQSDTWKELKIDSTRSSVEARLDQLAILLESNQCNLPDLRDGFEVQKVIESLLAR
jgi:predicted dehydrogenase